MPASSRKILLVQPRYSKATYQDVDRRAGLLQNPVLGLATIAQPLLDDGHDVRIADLDLEHDPYRHLDQTLKSFRPDWVGVTGTTPMALEMQRVAVAAKEVCPRARLVAGGVHVTTFPRQTLRRTEFDVVVTGEGDFTLRDILRCDRLDDVPGVVFRKNGDLATTAPRPLLQNLDELPLPAWQLFDLERYVNTSRLVERHSPSGPLETSRGCVFECIFCNKNIFRRRFRRKSPGRVVNEIERMLRAGFREVHVQDDGFSTDMRNAKQICDEIVARRLRFPWTLINGIRVDRTDDELFAKLKAAGCYQVAFGVESGNQAVLDGVQKGITKGRVRNAFERARVAKLETFAFFMLGLPGDTERTLQETIDFAVELDPDIVKFAVTVPMPGTPMFDDYDRRGLIRTRDWSRYLLHNLKEPVCDHPNLDWQTIVRSYRRAYRRFYFRPRCVARTLRRAVRRGHLVANLRYALATRWW